MKTELIVQARVHEWVKTLTDMTVRYEELPANRAELPCLSVQTLTGSPVERRYKDGSYIANYRFAVYLRQTHGDTAGRIDALSLLSGLSSAIDGGSLDLGDGAWLWSVTQDTLPCKIAVDEAFDDYQVTFSLKYKASK